MDILQRIADELQTTTKQIAAAIELLDGGATVPFIARYRKEKTGGLTDTQLRTLEERLHYLRELEERKQTILKSITEQQKLTPQLKADILNADNKATLEDLYLPYKPKRRTKAQIAIEAGLESLTEKILKNPQIDPHLLAADFINPEHNIVTTQAALDGVRHILMERFVEHAGLLHCLREKLWSQGILTSKVMNGKETEASKFSDYFNYQEHIKRIPSHRALALFRGQRENFLSLSLILSEAEQTDCIQEIKSTFELPENLKLMNVWLDETVRAGFRVKLFLKLELELFMRLREQAENEGIQVFANNLKHLLMTAPAGSRTTLGLDPGLRTGVKAVVVDGTGKLLANTTLFPHAPRNQWEESLAVLADFCKRYQVELVSIGNGTASRETDRLVADLKKRHPQLMFTSLVVSEAGASVYSASELAANEFPDLDVTYRGAVSIARRLQDPLAELVKIEPKAIGVGQYQHDVNQVKLQRSLHAVMEDCVNAVGVDINTASVPLLSCVAGLNEGLAKNIVQFRDVHGAFKNRQQLKKIARLGEKAFQQAAGFLRIVNGEQPLDASAVHPEAYPLVERILSTKQTNISHIMGNKALISSIKPQEYINEEFGLPTVIDILQELEKPGRDPRPEFKTARFKEDINTIDDLKPDMRLEGVVTNVSNFGAFVDIGVHQDGLVHISLLANKFVKNPHDIVKVGDIVTVKVLDIDKVRHRIQLSMRLDEIATQEKTVTRTSQNNNNRKDKNAKSVPQHGFGQVLIDALNKKK